MTIRDELAAKLRAAADRYLALAARLDEASSQQPYHEAWNSRQVAGHLIGWHEDLAAVLLRVREGATPLRPDSDYSQAGIDRQNADFAEAALGESHAALVDRVGRAVDALIDASVGIDDSWFAPGKIGFVAFQSAGYDHFGHHADALEQWLASRA